MFAPRVSAEAPNLDFQLGAGSLCLINYNILTPKAQEKGANTFLEVLITVDGIVWQVTSHSFCPIIDSTAEGRRSRL